jgi:hypothetical protein
MNSNIVSLISTRELLGKECREDIWLAVGKLTYLLEHETMFEHNLIYDLHAFLIKLVYKYPLVAVRILDRIEKWQRENEPAQSQIFLVNCISDLIDEEELDFLNVTCDEIKCFTL